MREHSSQSHSTSSRPASPARPLPEPFSRRASGLLELQRQVGNRSASAAIARFCGKPHAGLSMDSSFSGGATPTNVNTQTVLEYNIHVLDETSGELEKAELEVRAVTQELLASKDKATLEKAAKVLDRLTPWVFSQNAILEEAWQRCIDNTRSAPSLYQQVGPKFNRYFRKVLEELARSDPRWSGDIANIGTDFVNKHHLMLKSLYKDMQVLAENLLHAGRGSAATGNTSMHKAMHELTALTGGVNYQKMDPDVTELIKAAVANWKASPAHKLFE